MEPLDLMRLRDDAERLCLKAVADGDKDSADAWEEIGLAIDQAIASTKCQFATIAARRGLFA